MQPHIYQFNNKNIHYQEYGAGAYIKHNDHIIADFKSHIDAEAFLKLLSTTHPPTITHPNPHQPSQPPT